MDDDKTNYYFFVLNYYQKFFSDNTRVSWYSETIDALSASLIKYSKEYDRVSTLPPIQQFKDFRPDEMAPEFAIENQIGLILVLCQTYISNICKSVESFYNDYKWVSNSPIAVIPHKKHELLKQYGEPCNKTGYTDVEVIDALANYYKHHEEWSSRDSKITMKTKTILKAIGGNIDLNFYWAKNLSKLLSVLDVQIDSIKNLLRIVDRWKFSIRDAIPELGIILSPKLE